MNDTAAIANFAILLTALALFVLILWVLLPFAVFGSKPLLRELIAQQKQTNELLRSIQAHALEHDKGNQPLATSTARPSVWRSGRGGADADVPDRGG